MEVNTGEILSMVSLPDFDPNNKNFDENSTFNKNTLGVYEFGSVMKIFTTAIGIEENIFKPNTLYEIDDHIYVGKHKVHDVHRPCETKKCTVEEIFVHSSNVGTIKMIRDIGPDLQKKYLLDLGLLNQVIINLPERAEPLVPDPWTMASTESISYGYGLSISPLHLALATSTVLNGGYIIEPSLIKKDNQLFKNQIFSYLGEAKNIIPKLDLKLDLVFIDADKINYPIYLEMVVAKLKKGGVLIADNVLWSGKVLNKQKKSLDSETNSIKLFNELVKKDKRLETVLLPIRDGLMICKKV